MDDMRDAEEFSLVARDAELLSRRAFISGGSMAGVAIMMLGAAPACGTNPKSARAGGGVEIPFGDHAVTVQQLIGDEPLIEVEIVATADPGKPLYRSVHTGMLTDELIEILNRIRGVDLGAVDIESFNRFMRSAGLEELQVPDGYLEERFSVFIPMLLLISMIVFLLLWLRPG